MNMPPIDGTGELTSAVTFLKLTLKYLAEFSPEYQEWIVGTLVVRTGITVESDSKPEEERQHGIGSVA